MRQQKLARHRVARADDELAHLPGARLRELFLACFQKAHRAADAVSYTHLWPHSEGTAGSAGTAAQTAQRGPEHLFGLAACRADGAERQLQRGVNVGIVEMVKRCV